MTQPPDLEITKFPAPTDPALHLHAQTHPYAIENSAARALPNTHKGVIDFSIIKA